MIHLLFVLLIAGIGYFLFGLNGAIGGAIAGIFLAAVIELLDSFLNLATTKTCPHCGERIKRKAKVCRYCGRDL